MAPEFPAQFRILNDLADKIVKESNPSDPDPKGLPMQPLQSARKMQKAKIEIGSPEKIERTCLLFANTRNIFGDDHATLNIFPLTTIRCKIFAGYTIFLCIS